MGNEDRQELEELRKINKALVDRAVQANNPPTGAYAHVRADNRLEEQIRKRTSELSSTVADLERHNRQLVNAKDAAEHASNSKTRFLAAASHDVLQPLNAALLLMSSLSSVQENDEGRKLCRQVEHSLETMDTLLRNLLYMSRLDAGDVKPHFQTVSLDSLFDSIASDFEPIASVRNLELRVRRSGLHVWSDPTMLRRTIQNVVANALRYTTSGGALLVAGKRGSQVHIRIADTGVGIERSRFKEIFVEFQRCANGHDTLDGSAAGMGLGLAIVERMVHALNHTLTVNSRVGSGSCFSLILPFKELPKPSHTPVAQGSRSIDNPANANLTKARILIIEDDLAALQAMDALLGRWGCELRLASSAREAMSALSNERAWIPEIIVADQHLNNAERGTSVVRIIRQLIGRQVPAVIVTANPSEGLWKMADQGQLEVMQKPVKPAQLRALLTHLRTRSFELSA